MKFHYLSYATLFYAFLSHFCVGLRIFGCFPYINRSQYIVGLKLLKELAARGHEVSIMAHFLSNDEDNKFKFEISMASYNNFEDQMNLTGLTSLHEISTMMKLPKKSLQSFRFQKMMQEFRTFDVVIVDYIMNDAILGFGHFFNASIVVLSNFPGYEAKLVGSETLPYGLAMFRYDYSASFIKFSYMLLRTIEKCFLFEHDEYNEQEALYNDMFPDPKPRLAEVKNRVSLVLLYTHLSVDLPRLTAPNVIPVGGFHIDDSNPPHEVIASLDEFLVLDKVKEGIIHVSLGHSFYDHPDSIRTIADMMEAFGEIEHTVLWKWDNRQKTPKSPNNVVFNHFVQQKEILNHSLTKLFISDMGHLSYMEAIHFGVPVLALPSNFIGYHNQQFAVAAGMGIAMDLDNITKSTFLRNVEKILKNPMYAENAKLQSEIFRDRIVNPLDTAIYWVEYVAKFKGAQHLRVNPDHLVLLLYESIDLFAILLYGILPLFIWIGFTCYWLYRLCLERYHKEVASENSDDNSDDSSDEKSISERGTPEIASSTDSTPVNDLGGENVTDESISEESYVSENSSHGKNRNEENEELKRKGSRLQIKRTPTTSTSAANNGKLILRGNMLGGNIPRTLPRILPRTLPAASIPVAISIESTSTETTSSTDTFSSTEITSVNITSESNTSSGNTSAESIPEESIPAESVPDGTIISDQIPAETTPAENIPAESIPAEIIPFQNIPTESIPAESFPAESFPAESILVESIPAESIPVESNPVESIPVESIPFESNPVSIFIESTSSEAAISTEITSVNITSDFNSSSGNTSAESIPVDSIPEGTIITDNIPAQTTPPESIPAEIIPAENIPAESVPAESISGKIIPAESIQAKIIPAETIPAESIPVESIPANIIPAKSIPDEIIPAEIIPAENIPAESIPVESIPAESNPFESNPVSISIESTSTEAANSTEITSVNITSESNSSSGNTSAESIPEEYIPAESIPGGNIISDSIPAKTIPTDSNPVSIFIESSSTETTKSTEITSLNIYLDSNASPENTSAESIPEENIPKESIPEESIPAVSVPEETDINRIPVSISTDSFSSGNTASTDFTSVDISSDANAPAESIPRESIPEVSTNQESIPIEYVRLEYIPDDTDANIPLINNSTNNTPCKNSCGNNSTEEKSDEAGPSGLRRRHNKNQNKKSGKKQKKRF